MFYQQRIRGIDTTTEDQLKKENDNICPRGINFYIYFWHFQDIKKNLIK